MATRTVYLVRHGEYDWNDQPSPHKGLTPLGAEQARLTAKRLSSIPASVIHSSDLMRAVETADLICAEHRGVRYTKHVDLRECLLPSPNPSDAPAERIEAGKRQAESVFDAFCATSDHDTHDIIVSHGNIIRYLTARVLGDANVWCRMRTLNCGITQVEIASDGRMWVVSYNDVGHLPAHLITAGMPAVAPTAAAGTGRHDDKIGATRKRRATRS